MIDSLGAHRVDEVRGAIEAAGATLKMRALKPRSEDALDDAFATGGRRSRRRTPRDPFGRDER